jgi:hypothetical protein
MGEKVWVALIGAAAVLLSAIIAAAISFVTSWKLDRQMERLKAYLEKEKSLFDARLAYEYDAKKRLYEECEPLLFQAFNGLFDVEGRIIGLARDAARGRFQPGPNHWLRDRYYLQSTIYRLFQLIVCLHLLTQKMSQIDLNLDRFIARRIAILHTLQSTLDSEFRMAKSSRFPLTYDPHAKVSEEKRDSNPAVYGNQGFVHGEIDDIVAFMTSSTPSCISWHEFRKKVSKEPASIGIASDLFRGFHPRNSPVLWRILIGYALCVRFVLSSRPSLELADLERIVTAEGVARFDWRTVDEKANSANPDADDKKIMDNICAARDVVLKRYEENLRRYGQGGAEISANAEGDVE